MNRDPVDSSMIASIGYDCDKNILEIEFKNNGRIFEYYDVPLDEYEQIMNVESKGKYFLANIKPYFRCSRIG
jgi:hypothetical protein